MTPVLLMMFGYEALTFTPPTHPTPLDRTLAIQAEDRTLAIQAEDRTLEV